MNAIVKNKPATERVARNKTELKQILKELQGHYGKLSEVVMELVDNASSAFEKFNQTDGKVEIIIAKQLNDELHVIVRDNGMGIQDIDVALTLGKRSGALTALSGHGMGFKNLPVSKIVLRTVNQKGEAWEVKGPFVERVRIKPFAGFDDRTTGTELEFTISSAYLNADIARWGERSSATGETRTFFVLCDCLAEHIGVVMGKRMKKFGHAISIVAHDINGKSKTFNVEPLTLEVNPMKLVSQHPEIGITKGTATIPAFNGDGFITANFVFGHGTPSRKGRRGYFADNQVCQGWYISINGRYIGKTATISTRATHPSLNGLMGWVDLQVDYAEQAPQTEIAKTGFVEASHQYTALLEQIQQFIPSLDNVIRQEIKMANLHDIMRDELFEHMMRNKHNAGKEVEVPGGSKQEVDNLDYTDKVLYELKAKGATTRDVFQLYGYVAAYAHNTPMNIPFNKVYLCATDFPAECRAALSDANHMLEPWGIEIEPKFLYEIEGIKTLPSAKR